MTQRTFDNDLNVSEWIAFHDDDIGKVAGALEPRLFSCISAGAMVPACSACSFVIASWPVEPSKKRCRQTQTRPPQLQGFEAILALLHPLSGCTQVSTTRLPNRSRLIIISWRSWWFRP